MTFEEWQATRERVEDASDYGHDGPGFIYANGNIIILPAEGGEPERYQVIIENWCDEIGTDLAAMERVLWDGWAKDEVGDQPALVITKVYSFANGMTAVFDQFGQQMPQYQGQTEEMVPRIRAAGYTGDIPHGTYRPKDDQP